MDNNKRDDEQQNQAEERPRPSLRGKGRDILLGQQTGNSDLFDEPSSGPDQTPSTTEQPGDVDAASLFLTAEETDALLDFSDAALETPLPEPESLLDGPTPSDAEPAWWEETEISEEPAHRAGQDAAQDGVPMAERDRAMLAEIDERPYRIHPIVEELTPHEPEIWWQGPEHQRATGVHDTVAADEPVDEHDGGPVIAPEGAVVVEDSSLVDLPEPFDPVYERQPAKQLFDQTEPSDPSILRLLVDDEAIRKLAQQIEALQYELTEQVHSDRDSTDVYMNELLRASGLLMASRENYDDAKAIVFRVRADMKREEKVKANIMQFRPMLLLYYTGWGIALGVLFLLKALFVGITDAVGVEAFAAMYNPMLFGIAGALISGYLTLERHTTKLHDFDPVHVSWYLFNPLLGAVMGLIMFMIAAIANEDLLQDTGSAAEHAITYLLCVLAGMNQNNVLRQLNNLLRRVGPGDKE